MFLVLALISDLWVTMASHVISLNSKVTNFWFTRLSGEKCILNCTVVFKYESGNMASWMEGQTHSQEDLGSGLISDTC